MRKLFYLSVLLIVLFEVGIGYYYRTFLWSLVIFAPYILLGFHDVFQKKQTLKRNFPVFGHGRYLMEILRPKFYQYFVESDIDGAPINRIHRSLIYQRAKKALSTNPFGTQLNVYSEGYEWINHSMNPIDLKEVDHDLTVEVGGKNCSKPYRSSIFNVSAMSYGALSKNAILALNRGAKIGGFAHNTGEGGLSPFHLENAGDLIWQIGTGYFGTRTLEGDFDFGLFSEKSQFEQVKMIEIKLSQGAKPGHGGILPKSKNTPEIASIRNVQPGTDVISPPYHRAFSNFHQMLEFISKLREISKGKPIGIKLCFGHPHEFKKLCEAMKFTGLRPDFITIDGGEGGTGAAPLEFSNSVGTPLRDGLVKATDYLYEYDLKKDIKVICSGKIITGFDVVKNLALGADICNAARAMMMALGCIQALVCNTNKCPTGVATQDPELYKGLDIADKAVRVANYHHQTLEAVEEILAASGIHHLHELNRSLIYKRISLGEVKTFADIYPYPELKNREKASQKIA